MKMNGLLLRLLSLGASLVLITTVCGTAGANSSVRESSIGSGSIASGGLEPIYRTVRSKPFAMVGFRSNRMATLSKSYGSLPLGFEANQGQVDEEVKFLSRGRSYILYFTPTEAVMVFNTSLPESHLQPGVSIKTPKSPNQTTPMSGKQSRKSQIRMKLLGANLTPQIMGIGELPGKTNYLIGNDPKRWRTNISSYARVKYESVYPGVDLVYYGKGRQLEYDFIVAPGADPRSITLVLEGTENIGIGADGDLCLNTPGGEFRLRKPLIYQEIDGVKRIVPGTYLVTDTRQVSFRVAAYDMNKPLIIDPVLSYSTYLGGSSRDWGHGIALDTSDHVYVTGYTASLDFPTTSGALNETPKSDLDAFVVKLTADGANVIYSTYLGGSAWDYGSAIAVDNLGHAYIAGGTDSSDFPMVNPYQSVHRGDRDAYLAKLNPEGSALLYSTYLGGSFFDFGCDLAVDTNGIAYLTGNTDSQDFPTTPGVVLPAFGYFMDAFVAKINPAESGNASLVYSTFLHGTGDMSEDYGLGVAADDEGNTYATGITASSTFPTTPEAFQKFKGGGSYDAFVSKLSSDGTFFWYSTYLGGNDSDEGHRIAKDGDGNMYVIGFTSSMNFPIKNGYQASLGGMTDVFITKLDPAGAGSASLLYSTLLGGSGFDQGYGIAVDPLGYVYVTGMADSSDFPTKGAFQAIHGGYWDSFVAKIDPVESGAGSLIYSTYVGGIGSEAGETIAVDSSGNAYVTGWTESVNFPIVALFQPSFRGPVDAFVAKIVETSETLADLELSLTSTPDQVKTGTSLTYTVTVSNHGPNAATGTVVTDILPPELSFASAGASQGTCTDTSSIVCDLGTLDIEASATVNIVVVPNVSGVINNTVSSASSVPDPDVTNNSKTETTTVLSPTADLRLAKTDSSDPIMTGNDLTYTISIINTGPDSGTGVIVTDTLPQGVIFVSAMSSQGSCSQTEGTVICNIGDMTNGAAITATIAVKAPNTPGTLGNTAAVSSFTDDPDPTNNTATATTTVLSYPKVVLFSPNGGETIPSGSTYEIRWGAPQEAATFKFLYSLDGGVTWVVIGKNIIGTSTTWHTPILKKNNKKVLLKMIAFDASGNRVGSDKSDGPFTIEVLTITDPISGDTCTSGQLCLIAWNRSAYIDARTGKLSYTTNGGLTWKPITNSIIESDTSYSSWIPAVGATKSNCKVKLVYKNDKGVTVGTATSGKFTIKKP